MSIQDVESNQKWGLEFWEHEPGKSWARAVFDKIEPTMRAFASKRILKMMEKDIKDVRKIGDIEKVIDEIQELKVKIPKNEIRFLGPLRFPINEMPVFEALHCFHKKTRKLPQKEIDIARQRFSVYKKKKGL